MNPVLKRTLTGLAVGCAVIAASLLAPPGAIVTVVMVLAVLAMVEFALLMKLKAPRPGAVHAVVFLAGVLLIGYGLLSLASVPLRYGESEMCGPFRLGNVMLLYVIAIVKFSDVGGFAFGLTSAKLMKGGNHKMCPSVSPGKS